MTNILLSIIAVLLFARIVLQIRQEKRAVEKGYAAPSEVENVVKVVNADDPFDMKQMPERMSAEGWELVSTHRPNPAHLYLFFTRKKIKNYYD